MSDAETVHSEVANALQFIAAIGAALAIGSPLLATQFILLEFGLFTPMSHWASAMLVASLLACLGGIGMLHYMHEKGWLDD